MTDPDAANPTGTPHGNAVPVSPPEAAPSAAAHHTPDHFLGQIVVLDTQGPLIYIGTLASISHAHYILAEADVHDTNDSRSSKELYLLETRDLGVRVNRARVIVERREIVSLSLLIDIRD